MSLTCYSRKDGNVVCSKFHWFRVHWDNSEREVIGIKGNTYNFSSLDIGKKIKCKVEVDN